MFGFNCPDLSACQETQLKSFVPVSRPLQIGIDLYIILTVFSKLRFLVTSQKVREDVGEMRLYPNFLRCCAFLSIYEWVINSIASWIRLAGHLLFQ